ncbi:MAG: lipoyl(octanoyl) transferase LipB [Solirubrobacterales bacterium]|nr:lipoyl(octanoyl) transferase LipB [Solirubrobacterales bacterium]MBV9714639.1 lipoyl(octanoyl) transferase LipB [Solirubrobacterales bacterium]
MSDMWVCHLGVIGYGEALALQQRLCAARQAEAVPDVLLMLEHPPVYTRGRRSAPGELPLGEEWYRAQGIEIVQTDRGGKVTYHGPGQLVGYPIVRTDDVVGYVRTLEDALVTALGEEGVAARARPDEGPAYTGVWVQERKIASIGVHLSRGVTTHGFAVNVENDLEPFEWIVPCGLSGVRMTSVIEETGRRVWKCFRRRAAYRVAEALGRRQRLVTRERLEPAARGASAPALAAGA